MYNPTKPLLILTLLLTFLSSCEGLEKTDKIREEVLTRVNGKDLLYEMHLTGLDKYRYVYKLASPQDTVPLFETKFVDETGNYAGMEFEQLPNGLRITLDRPIEKQTKIIDGYTFELAGAKK